jgi:hypothetical protein
MPDKDLFEYAVIRIVPRVEREEFINAGVIVYCAKQKFLKVRYAMDEARVRALCPEADVDMIAENLESIEHISEGKQDAGPIAALDLPGRFRWLTAVRSTVVQTSRPHPGLCDGDANHILDRLFHQLVA